MYNIELVGFKTIRVLNVVVVGNSLSVRNHYSTPLHTRLIE